eukprot:UN11587
MSTTIDKRLTNKNSSKFVLVEWDDGSMEHTQWYLGQITDYNANNEPNKFKDLGIEAYGQEKFSFLSHLMHHYMILKDGDTIRGKADNLKSKEELFKISITNDILHILHPNGKEFDLESKKLIIIGPITNNKTRLITGGGCIDDDTETNTESY